MTRSIKVCFGVRGAPKIGWVDATVTWEGEYTADMIARHIVQVALAKCPAALTPRNLVLRDSPAQIGLACRHAPPC